MPMEPIIPEDLTVYNCPLDAETIEKAKQEINEDPDQRLLSVKELAAWIKEQENMICRTDVRYLLAYLRAAKFNQRRAQKMLTGTLSMATQIPNWFKNIDTRDPALRRILDTGFCLPVHQTDSNGSPMMVQRLGAVDASYRDYSVDDQMKAGLVVGSALYQHDATQVNGVVFLIDFTNYSVKHAARFTVAVLKQWLKALQGNLPGRYKAFHMYNMNWVMSRSMRLIKPFLNEKLAQRIFLHDSLESLRSSVEHKCLPLEYHPDGYEGPHAGTIRELTDKLMTEIDGPLRDWLLYDSHMKWTVRHKTKQQS